MVEAQPNHGASKDIPINMTTAHVETFAELVGKDPALLAKLGLDKVNADAAAAAASAGAFITDAVKEATTFNCPISIAIYNAIQRCFVEKFTELIGKDPELLAKLGVDKVNADAAAASASAAAYITNAVKEGKALGLRFTEEEVHAFMDAEAKAAASGELSDTQLDAVAGRGWDKHQSVEQEAKGELGKDPLLLAKLGLDKVNADGVAASASEVQK